MKRKNIFFLLKIGVGAALITFLIEKVDWNRVLVQLSEISLVLVVLYVLFQLLGNLISAKKWQVIAAHKGLSFTLKDGFFTYLAGAFINNFLPSTIGGDTYRSLWLANQTDAKAASVSTVVFDRFIGLWTMALLALLFSLSLWQELGESIALQISVAFLSAFLVVDGIVTYAYFRPWFRDLLEHVPFKIKRLIEEIVHCSEKKLWTVSSLYSALFAFVGVGITNLVLFYAVGEHIHPLSFLSVIFIVTIISSIPVSVNNIGIKEWAYFTFFPLAGVNAEAAVTVALLSRFLQMFISFIALPEYLRSRKKKN